MLSYSTHFPDFVPQMIQKKMADKQPFFGRRREAYAKHSVLAANIFYLKNNIKMLFYNSLKTNDFF